MKRKKSVGNKPDDLQNIFTAYLPKAVHRRRDEYIYHAAQRQKFETQPDDVSLADLCDTAEDQAGFFPLWMQIESETLLSALETLSERERTVLIARVLEEKPFRQIAAWLGMSPKGTAAMYYRVRQKLRKRMEGQNR